MLGFPTFAVLEQLLVARWAKHFRAVGVKLLPKRKCIAYTARGISELLQQSDVSKEADIHSYAISKCPFQDRSGLMRKE